LNIQDRYQQALDAITAKLLEDKRVVAAFIAGSLSYDVVWEKSDIDLVIVTDDEKRSNACFALTEYGICISANVLSRQAFKSDLERGLQTGHRHSFLAKSRPLICRDAAIQGLYDGIRHVGERDLDIQLLTMASWAVTALEKVEKWLVVKRDPIYSFFWLMKVTETLAGIEVMLHRDIPIREVVQQALAYNPGLFGRLYTDAIEGPKTEARMSEALQLADAYIDKHHKRLFKLVLDYLADERDVRPFSDLMQHLRQHHRVEDMLIVHGCEWLAQKGYIERASYPLKLTAKSRTELDELAYFDAKEMFM
jgi:uncharacterized protein